MSSFYLPSTSSATQRRPSQNAHGPVSSGPQRPPVSDPAPNPRPIFQLLAFGLIVFFGFLQFLPATHFRDPSDPFRNWVPFDSTTSSSSLSKDGDGRSNFVPENGGEDGMVHIVSWMDCLDLRVLAVLANSTLSNSRYPDGIYFHFFVPGGNVDKVSYYKLKVLFPDSNLEIHGQEEVKENIMAATSASQYPGLNFEEIAPFVIPRIHQSLSKFIYVSPYVIMKGRVEELIGVDLGMYAIAAAEDCSKTLNTCVNSDVLEAIQRSASKPWVSETPYAKDTCTPDLSVLLIDARKLEKNLVKAILWWSKVLNLGERSGHQNPAIALALYDSYLKLSTYWLVKDSQPPEHNNSRLILHYDGPKISCSEFGKAANLQGSRGNLWTQYLPPMSDQILGN